MKTKALIISIKTTELSKSEINFITKGKPWGVILFKRNLKSYSQIKNLTFKIRSLARNKHFPIIIDEEGKSVSRLANIISHDISANFFGKLYLKNKSFCSKIFIHYIESLTKILKDLGFNINTIPVLDVLRFNTNKIIGNRSFSRNKKIVNELGFLTVEYLKKNKIAGVIKHIPGHGASISDSHKKMPMVSMNLKKLNHIDFYAFKSLNAQFAMTAHILYKKIDNKNVATFSKKVINEVIRKRIGFKGIIISDDISMKALKYDLITNAKKSLDAGCNLVLYCSGKASDNFKLLKSLPYIDKFTAKKTSEFFKFLR